MTLYDTINWHDNGQRLPGLTTSDVLEKMGGHGRGSWRWCTCAIASTIRQKAKLATIMPVDKLIEEVIKECQP